jgi:hypothetical protein
MNKLSTEGFEITVNGSTKRYFGVLAFGLGDTLAMQWLGGYVEGVGKAYKFFRNCEITRQDRLEGNHMEFAARDLSRH